ncbi:MAG TPA: hypothetical protein V6C95_21785 [Coleofasciculaceae cyanobacterium]
MAEFSKDELRDRMGNIDLIRDIIFGPKLQEYDSRLEKLESNLSALEKEMRERTEQVKTDCLTELQTAIEALDQKIKSLSLTHQKDNTDIRQLIDRSYKNFTGSLESIDKTVVSQNNSIRKDLSETRERLQDDIRNLKSQICDEIEKRFAMLSDAKVAKNDMADILFELGLRLKGADFSPKLNETASTDGSDEPLLIEASKIPEVTPS